VRLSVVRNAADRTGMLAFQHAQFGALQCPIGTTLEKRFRNGLWYPGTVKSGPFQFNDDAEIIA